MKCLREFIIYQNSDPLLVSRQAVFPGIVQLKNSELLAMFSIGQAFDSADQRAHVSNSQDMGQTWSTPRPLHNHSYQPRGYSESFKPLLLSDGSLMAAGYGFERPDPLTPIVDPENFDLLPLKNMVSFSRDNGQNWDVPRIFDIKSAPMEMSGPCIQLQSGRIIGAAAPFHLGETGHAGWIIFSDDSGQNWGKLSEFYASPNGEISPWECRLCEMEPNQIAVLFWAYDNKNKRNLPNKLVYSHDGGKTFGAPIDTQIQGQASNLIWLGDDSLLTIHTHREPPVGLWVRKVNTTNEGLQIKQELNLFSSETMGSDSADIRKQFGSLKFGQPSLLKLDDGTILAALWSFENCQYVIKGYILEI